MKCIYYLSPSLVSTQSITDDLHQIGIADWFLHVVSKNEAGLKKQQVHSSNYIETLDMMREGLLGACSGFLVGLIAAVVFNAVEPFSPNVPMTALIGIVVLCTGFGAWLGGLNGIAHENKKLSYFHDDIESGKYLILIYAHKNEESKIIEMMRKNHSETQLVGFDNWYYNPFSSLELVTDSQN